MSNDKTPLRGLQHKYRDMDRYESKNKKSGSSEAEEEEKRTSSDTTKLLKSSLARQAAETTGSSTLQTPKTRPSQPLDRPASPPESQEGTTEIVVNSPPGSRAARMKKIQRRRDRITVVQNPTVSLNPEPPVSTKPPMSPIKASQRPPLNSPPMSNPMSPPKKLSPNPIETETARRELRAAAHRKRVAGGAAAKLMLQGPKSETKEDAQDIDTCASDSTFEDAKFTVDIDEYSSATEELDRVRRKTRVEYDIGTPENKRYRDISDSSHDEEDDDMGSEASLPSILDRSEIFHENAAAAIMSLLYPQGVPMTDGGSVISGFSALSGAPSTFSRGVGGDSTLSPSRNVLSSAPGRGTQDREVSAVSALDAPNVAFKKVPNQPFLSARGEKKVEIMKDQMIDPSKTLADLLTAVASPADGVEKMDQAYMVRRKNACGALKVLTANVSNRRTIGWTVGVLPALASVLNDGGEETLQERFPDARIRAEYAEARRRAVAALLNLSLLKENRIPIMHCPGLVIGIAKTILQDKEESRQGCSAILGYLAKTTENRLLMVKVPGVLNAINDAIKPWSPPEEMSPLRVKRFWDSYDTSFSSLRNNSSTTGETGGGTTNTDGTETDYSTKRDDDSDATPTMSPTSQTTTSLSYASKRSYLYENDPNKFVQPTRQNLFATLLHLVKEKDNTFHIARHPDLLFTFVDISYMQESPSHLHAIKIIANLTRHRGNSKLLVFNNRQVIPALVHSLTSHNVESRIFACRAMQNVSQDQSCRQNIAITKKLVESLVHRVTLATDQEEKLAAVSTLKNLADEPTNVIPMSNTPSCFAALMQVAHGKDGNTTEAMQFQACDALATLSYFLRKIASTDSIKQRSSNYTPKASELMNPTLRVVSYSQWA